MPNPLRLNLTSGEYCPWCQNEGWVWLRPASLLYHEAMPVSGCRWCEEGDRLLRRFPWIVKDYACEDVDIGSVDLSKRHILRPQEMNQLERMIKAQGVDYRAERPAFVQPALAAVED